MRLGVAHIAPDSKQRAAMLAETTTRNLSGAEPAQSPEPSPQRLDVLADCILQVSRFGYDAFGLLSRYETALWRQAAQLPFILQSGARR